MIYNTLTIYVVMVNTYEVKIMEHKKTDVVEHNGSKLSAKPSGRASVRTAGMHLLMLYENLKSS